MPSDVYFPRVNGVSTSIATFRGELPALGVEVTLLAPAYGPRDAVETDLLRLPGRPVPFDPEDRFVSPRRFRLALAEARPAAVVHVQTPFGAHRAGVAAARARGIPVVETYHTDFEHYFEHYVPLLPTAVARAVARALARRQGNAVDQLIVPSRAMREVLSGYGVTTPIDVLPTGLPAAAFAPGDGARFRAERGIPAEAPLLVHVGRLGHEKNLRFLFAACERVLVERPAAHWLIAGEGPARAELERRAVGSPAGARIHRLGYLDRELELPSCYAAGDLFVFTSKTETQGLVLLEAMAQGVPVVALAELGTRDLLDDGRGCVVPAEDAAMFAAACVALLDDAERRVRLGREALEVARAWSARAGAGRLRDLYLELAGRSRTARSR